MAGSASVSSRAEILVGETGVLERISFLERYILFRFVNSSHEAINWRSFRVWAASNWGVPGSARNSHLGDDLHLLECRSRDEVDRICRIRRCSFGSFRLLIGSWSEMAGCTEMMEKLHLEWVVAKGIPLHLRSNELFRSLGDLCGGFVDVDEKLCDWNSVRLKVSAGSLIPESAVLHFRKHSFRISFSKEAKARLSQSQCKVSGIAAQPQEASAAVTIPGGALSSLGMVSFHSVMEKGESSKTPGVKVWKPRRSFGGDKGSFEPHPSAAMCCPGSRVSPVDRSSGEDSTALSGEEGFEFVSVDVTGQAPPEESSLSHRRRQNGCHSEDLSSMSSLQSQKVVSEFDCLGPAFTELVGVGPPKKRFFVGLCLRNDVGLFVATRSTAPHHEATLFRLLRPALGPSLSFNPWALGPIGDQFSPLAFNGLLNEGSISCFGTISPAPKFPPSSLSQTDGSNSSTSGDCIDSQTEMEKDQAPHSDNECAILEAVAKVASTIDLQLEDSREVALNSVLTTAATVLRRRKLPIVRSRSDRELLRLGNSLEDIVPSRTRERRPGVVSPLPFPNEF
ncbi:hypothetical protein LINPERPRIM_LOCUS21411 [Linum perenne]